MAGFTLPQVNPDVPTVPSDVHLASISALPAVSTAVAPVASAPIVSTAPMVQAQPNGIASTFKQLLPAILSAIAAKQGGPVAGSALLNGYSSGIAQKHQRELEQQQMQARLDATNLAAQQNADKLTQDRQLKLSQFVENITKQADTVDDPETFAAMVDLADKTAQQAFGAAPGLIKGTLVFNDQKRLDKSKKDAQTLIDNFVKLYGPDALQSAAQSGAMIGGKRLSDLMSITQYGATDAQGKPLAITPTDTPINDEKSFVNAAVADAKKQARMAGKPWTGQMAMDAALTATRKWSEANRKGDAGGDAIAAVPPVPPMPGGARNEAYLNQLPDQVKNTVKALADGRMAFPSGTALKSAYWQTMLQHVANYDPSFDTINYNARLKTRQDFTSGKSAQQVNALNTVIGHLDSLKSASDNLNNGDYTSWNAVSNWFANATGKPAPRTFEATREAVADELTRVWRQAGGSEADIQERKQQLSTASSPAQFKAVIGQIGDLLESKLESMQSQYQQGMGISDIQMLTPKSKQTLEKLRGMSTNAVDASRIRIRLADGTTGTIPAGTPIPAGATVIK